MFKNILIIIFIVISYFSYAEDINDTNGNYSVLLGVSNTAVDSTVFGMADVSIEANANIKYGLFASLEILYNYGFGNLSNYQAISFIPNLKYYLPEMYGFDLGLVVGTGYSGVNFDGGQDIGIISQMLIDLKYNNYSLSGGFRIINNDYYNLKTSFVGFRYFFKI